MATRLEVKEALVAAFVAGWSGQTAPVTYDNETFDSQSLSSFVRVAVRFFDSDIGALGGPGVSGQRKYTRVGAVFVQCFCREGIGTRTADLLAEAAANIFEGKSFLSSQIRISGRVPVIEIGPDGEGFYQINVEANFEYDERK